MRETAVPGPRVELACVGALVVGVTLAWWKLAWLTSLPLVVRAPVYAAGGETKGPIAKNLDGERVAAIKAAAGLRDGDGVFFACD